MKFTFHSPRLRRPERQAKAAALGEAARGSAAAVSQKAEDTLLYAKLHRAIKDLHEEIDLQLRDLGEMIYDTHRGTPSDSEDVQAILEHVDSLYEQIDGHERQMKALRGILVCDACGQENPGTNVYCQECGQPLSRW